MRRISVLAIQGPGISLPSECAGPALGWEVNGTGSALGRGVPVVPMRQTLSAEMQLFPQGIPFLQFRWASASLAITQKAAREMRHSIMGSLLRGEHYAYSPICRCRLFIGTMGVPQNAGRIGGS